MSENDNNPSAPGTVGAPGPGIAPKVPLSSVVGTHAPQPSRVEVLPAGDPAQAYAGAQPPMNVVTPGTTGPQPASQTSHVAAAPQMMATATAPGGTAPALTREEYERMRLQEENERQAREASQRAEYQRMAREQRAAYARVRIEIGKHVAAALASNDQLEPGAVAERALKVADALIAASGIQDGDF